MTGDCVQRDLRPKTFAVANVAPICARGYRGRRALAVFDPRQALDEPAMAAEMNADAARRSFRFVEERQRIAPAKITEFGHDKAPGRNR
jgi:hypothetical protein